MKQVAAVIFVAKQTKVSDFDISESGFFINALKTVAFIAGKKNPAIQKFYICFSIENLIANISFYALSWPKLNFGCYLTFEIIFKLYFNGKTNKNFLDCWIFLPAINATVFICLRFDLGPNNMRFFRKVFLNEANILNISIYLSTFRS